MRGSSFKTKQERAKAPLSKIYRYEIPGGQYSNLRPQVASLGLGHRFDEVREMFCTVNQMLGDIVKVTPSSKMVGDLAIFMVQNDLPPENIVERGKTLAFPDSVVSYSAGNPPSPTKKGRRPPSPLQQFTSRQTSSLLLQPQRSSFCLSANYL